MFRPQLKYCHNKFTAVPVATAKKLFETYGFSRATVGHPDNTDPYHFTDPSNPVASPLEELGRVNTSVLREAYTARAASSAPADDLPDDSTPASEDKDSDKK